MANVRFVKTTKERYLKRESFDANALYFCEDTQEIFKGDRVYTDGIRVLPTRADLPSFGCAADGVVYYITDTRAGFMLAPTRDAWFQTIYAPVADVNSIPEGEEYNVVTTVGAVRDIENAIYQYIDDEIAKVEVTGGQGADGKTPYIQDGYWYIDGVNTNVQAEGKDGIDGKTPIIEISDDGYWVINGAKTAHKAIGIDGKDGAPGINGKDGINGQDGVPGKDGVNGQDGKDGESAYDIWLNAGHSGSEDDFLQWLKGDTEPFEDVVTSIECDGIPAGTSLKGKTVKDVLVMLLGIKEAPKPVVEYIIDNRIPAYNGTLNSQTEEVEYQLLDADTANYTDQGFYTSTDEEGNIMSAGYQLTIEGNNNADAQVIAIPANAVIKMAYRYDLGGTNTWLPYTFDVEDEANYWLPGDTLTTTVNGGEVTYQTYMYNIDVVGGGDALTSTEYWRFEIEVTN